MSKCGAWIDELMCGKKKFIVLDTRDGIRREGRITGFTTREMEFNGVTVSFPTEIELNGDVNDRVTIDRIEKMEIKI
jgi:hypothetical protein